MILRAPLGQYDHHHEIFFIIIIRITITIHTFTHINILQMVKFTIIVLTLAKVYGKNHHPDHQQL